MAKKKKGDDDATNKIMWIAGGAAVTAVAIFYVNRHLNERDELNRLRYAESQRKIPEKSEE